jgi:hypothetical protein
MFSRYSFSSALLIAMLTSALARSHSSEPHLYGARARRQSDAKRDVGYDGGDHFTVQVAAFPDETQANKLIARLIECGLQPTQGAVELPGRGRWVRVFVGSFVNKYAARRYGQSLMARGLIKGFLVKAAAGIRAIDRSRTFNMLGAIVRSLPFAKASAQAGSNLYSVNFHTEAAAHLVSSKRRSDPIAERTLPAHPLALDGAVILDAGPLPWPDPVEIAFSTVAGGDRSMRGGLWLTGDIDDGLARLRWIAGKENARLISVDRTGKVNLDKTLLAKAAGAASSRAGAALIIANYISSNEGLKLLVQVTQGPRRYWLHIGNRAQTAEGEVEIEASVNLDNNYDSRINPYRRGGKKLGRELPPEGFDSLVAINPTARWFNLRTGRLVPAGCITFHELAEAYAKVQLGLEYLPKETKPGAHNLALERELKLQTERSAADVVVTAGSNRVLRSERELRRFSEELQGKTSFKD